MIDETDAVHDVPADAGAAGADQPGATPVSDPATSDVQHNEPTPHALCRNCGTELTGAFCAACGQRAHLHRSLLALGHDLLHGVFHFEGKVWRTLPELLLRPGRLTRRYIEGERTKFVSPMALYLFTVFLTFAVFALLGSAHVDTDVVPGSPDWRAAQGDTLERLTADLEATRARLADPATPAEELTILRAQIKEIETTKAVIEALAAGDWQRLQTIEDGEADAASHTPWPAPGGRIDRFLKRLQANPDLLGYKIKTNAYKYSWGLIPLSIPFVWLLFFWRRDIPVYDHAIFVTYSISFMMLFGFVLSLLAAIGVPDAIWGIALVTVPPLHLYKHLRGAYQLSRLGAIVRLGLLTIFIVVILASFLLLLVLAGAFM